MLGWDRYEIHKKRIGTDYDELVFLQPVGSAGHVVHSGASAARNIGALFFMLGWAWCGFQKKRAGKCYAKLVFLHPMGSAGQVVPFGASSV